MTGKEKYLSKTGYAITWNGRRTNQTTLRNPISIQEGNSAPNTKGALGKNHTELLLAGADKTPRAQYTIYKQTTTPTSFKPLNRR